MRSERTKRTGAGMRTRVTLLSLMTLSLMTAAAFTLASGCGRADGPNSGGQRSSGPKLSQPAGPDSTGVSSTTRGSERPDESGADSRAEGQASLRTIIRTPGIAKMAQSSDGVIFYTVREDGELMALPPGSKKAVEIADFRVIRNGETGLLGVAVHPDYPKTPEVFVYTTEPTGGEPKNYVTKITIGDPVALKAGSQVDSSKRRILSDIPSSPIHNGGALGIGPDRKLYITTGDARNQDRVRDLDYLGGKMLRLELDGSVPDDNPFKGSPVYTFGHRNIFGISFTEPSGPRGDFTVIISENGPDVDDEVNFLRKGADHGWPSVTGTATDEAADISTSRKTVPASWAITPCIAPTGIAFITNGAHKGRVLLGDYNTGTLRILTSKDSSASAGEALSELGIIHKGDPVVDIARSPDGRTLYIVDASGISELTF